MLNPNFKNGQRVDLQAAFASFIIMMGFLFYIEATSGLHRAITLMTILVGLIWFIARQYQHHHHGSSDQFHG